MYHTTGLTRGQLTDLVATVHQFLEKEDKKSGRPPVIGLFKSVVAVLWYLRRNRVQAEIAELLGVSQSTVSRRITTLTPVLEEVLADYIPTLEDLPDKDTLIVDGSLLLVLGGRARVVLRQAPHHRPQCPGRHRPGRPPLVRLRARDR